MRCLRLPFTFEPGRLTNDLHRVEPAEWIPHFNSELYKGEWSGAALRSIEGSADNLVPEAADASRFQDTVLLGRCPYFREILGTFKCPLHAVRLLRLGRNASVAEHVDSDMDFEDGVVRLHVPIVTSEQACFYLDGARLTMAPGECWYTNVNLPHAVFNRSRVERVHLIIDCQVNERLRGVFAAAERPPCDHYAARIWLPTTPSDNAVAELLARWARANQAELEDVRNTLVLSWAGAFTWQIRLRVPDPSSTSWSAFLESSPDPDQRHRRDYDELVDALRVEFSGVVITSETPKATVENVTSVHRRHSRRRRNQRAVG